jgi:hypothetical protein
MSTIIFTPAHAPSPVYEEIQSGIETFQDTFAEANAQSCLPLQKTARKAIEVSLNRLYDSFQILSSQIASLPTLEERDLFLMQQFLHAHQIEMLEGELAVEPSYEQEPSTPLTLPGEVHTYLAFETLGRVAQVSKAWRRSCQSIVPYLHSECLLSLHKWGQLMIPRSLNTLPIQYIAFDMKTPRTPRDHYLNLETFSRRLVCTLLQSPLKCATKVVEAAQDFTTSPACPLPLRDRLIRCIGTFTEIQHIRTVDINTYFPNLTPEQTNIQLEAMHHRAARRIQDTWNGQDEEDEDPGVDTFSSINFQIEADRLLELNRFTEAFAVAMLTSSTHLFNCAEKLAERDPRQARSLIEDNETFLVANFGLENTLSHQDPDRAEAILAY